MTFNDNARSSGSGVSRRGAGVAVGGGVAGIGAIAVLLFSLFTGVDLTGLVGGGQAGGTTDQGTPVAECTGAEANANVDCRLALGSDAINSYWASEIDGYTPPQLVLVQGSTPTQCGTASNATGPFYCPPEQTVYIDPTFFDVLQQQFGDSAGSLAQLYVLAHEYGHHVQNITGVFDQHPNDGSTGADSVSVRTELQADCFAGAWVAAASDQRDESGTQILQPPTQAEITDALDAAAAVGDDHIQQSAGGVTNPDSWTHGSSEQRQRWFEAGRDGGPRACDTFSVSAGDL